MWNNVKSWFKHSATIVWARILILLGFLAGLADILTASNIQSYIPSKYVPWYLVAVGIITEIARRRTL